MYFQIGKGDECHKGGGVGTSPYGKCIQCFHFLDYLPLTKLHHNQYFADCLWQPPLPLVLFLQWAALNNNKYHYFSVIIIHLQSMSSEKNTLWLWPMKVGGIIGIVLAVLLILLCCCCGIFFLLGDYCCLGKSVISWYQSKVLARKSHNANQPII